MGLEWNRRKLAGHGFRDLKVDTVSATIASASTALPINDVIALTSTSTTGPVVFTLSRAPKPGEHLAVNVLKAGASSAGAGYHVNAYGGSFFGSSSQDMATLLGHGDGFIAIATSTIRWGVVGNNNATFSTST